MKDKLPKKERFGDTQFTLSNGTWKVFRYRYSDKTSHDYTLTDGEYAICKMLEEIIKLLECIEDCPKKEI